MIKLNFPRLGASLLVFALSLNFNSNQAQAQTCATPPSCASLGYLFTEAGCQDAFLLRCPFDTTKVYCTKIKCPIGAYAYTDGSCSSSLDSTKTTVGIVFDPINRMAWQHGSSLTGLSGINVVTWDQAKNNPCSESISGIALGNSRLGTKVELETWAAAFPASKGPNAPAVTQTVWTASENDASTAWVYKVTIGKQIDAKKAIDKNTKQGLFCVEKY